MTGKSNNEKQPLNIILWGATVVLVVIALWANYHFSQIALPLRMIGWLCVIGIGLGFVVLTSQGRRAIGQLSDARSELRKVVWPTRQEVVQMTFMVIAFVAVMSLILWGLDSVLLYVVGLLTGQRG